MKRQTKEEFIQKAKAIHGDKFSYDLVNYMGGRIKVKIVCSEHGIFSQLPKNHVHLKQGCPSCYGNKKLRTNDFINKSKSIHNNKYDYSKTIYSGNKGKVEIICGYHGSFFQTATRHLSGGKCPKCNGRIAITQDEFIQKAKSIHGNKYDYSLVVYKNTKTKIKIICDEHGVFEMKPNAHIGQQTQGCKKCALSERTLTTENFIKKAIKRHGNKYNYSKVQYKRNNIPIIILCKKHGEFSQKPNTHLNGRGCRKCFKESISMSKSDFIKKCKKIHNNKYDYSILDFENQKSKIKVICPEHGEFIQEARVHLMGCGCGKCSESKGEKKIRNYLVNNNIKFETQKSFNNCRNKLLLFFDFYLPECNILIEYDGELHSQSIKHFGGKKTLNEQIKRDNIKNEYAIDNGINLIRISYSKFSNIESILGDKLNLLIL